MVRPRDEPLLDVGRDVLRDKAEWCEDEGMPGMERSGELEAVAGPRLKSSFSFLHSNRGEGAASVYDIFDKRLAVAMKARGDIH